MKRDDLYALRAEMKEVGQLREKIAELELKRISPRSAAYGAERVQSSPKGDIQPDQIAKMDDLIAEYREKLNNTLMKQKEFEQLISTLPTLERRIMRYYYIDGLKWEEVWQRTNYCVRHLTRINRKALDELFPNTDDKPNGNHGK